MFRSKHAIGGAAFSSLAQFEHEQESIREKSEGRALGGRALDLAPLR
jgi:hypothetical protein